MNGEEAVMLFDSFLASHWHAPETRRYYTLYARQFLRCVGEKEVVDITVDDINKYVNAADDAHYSTRKKRLIIVKVFMRFCRSNQWLGDRDRFAEMMVKVNWRILQPRQREGHHRIAFTEEELATILKSCKGGYAYFKYAIEICMETGLRIGDVINLKWSQVGSETLIVFTRKSNHRIPITMTPKLIETLASMPQRPPLEHVVQELKSGREIPLFGWDNIELAKKSNFGFHCARFKNLCKMAGVKGKTFHCIRHFYIAKCRALGIATPHISAMVGHSDIKTTNGYGLSYIIERNHPLNWKPE